MLYGYVAIFNTSKFRIFNKTMKLNIIVDREIDRLEDICKVEREVSEKTLYGIGIFAKRLELVGLIPVNTNSMYRTKDQIQIDLINKG